jgi:hypothetical protein
MSEDIINAASVRTRRAGAERDRCRRWTAAADEIERLRADLCTAWEQAERWRDERDEARREISIGSASTAGNEQRGAYLQRVKVALPN